MTKELIIYEKISDFMDDSVKLMDVRSHSNLKDLGLDSIDIMDVVYMLENEFKTSVSDKDVEECKTVGDIVNLFVKG